MKIAIMLLASACHAATPTIVACVGDSFTWGYSYPSGTQNASNYPVLLLNLLKPKPSDNTVHNLGVSGIRVGPLHTLGFCNGNGVDQCTMLDCAREDRCGLGLTVDSLVDPLKNNILVVEGGGPSINSCIDLGTEAGCAAGLYGYWTQYYTARKAAGWNQIIATTTVSGGDNCTPPKGNTCTADAIRAGGTWANSYSTYQPATCTCPTSNCSIATSEAGSNGRLVAAKGDADVLINLQTTAAGGLFGSFFGPNDTTYRTCDGHWTTALNQQMAYLVAGKINPAALFPVGATANAGRR